MECAPGPVTDADAVGRIGWVGGGVVDGGDARAESRLPRRVPRRRLMVQHCRRHAEQGEVDLIHVTKCKHAGCSTIPSFGLEGGQPEFCKQHRLSHHKGLVG